MLNSTSQDADIKAVKQLLQKDYINSQRVQELLQKDYSLNSQRAQERLQKDYALSPQPGRSRIRGKFADVQAFTASESGSLAPAGLSTEALSSTTGHTLQDDRSVPPASIAVTVTAAKSGDTNKENSPTDLLLHVENEDGALKNASKSTGLCVRHAYIDRSINPPMRCSMNPRVHLSTHIPGHSLTCRFIDSFSFDLCLHGSMHC